MMKSSTDCIQKEITLRAPRSRVWRALSDHVEFGEWFGVRLEAPFQVGAEFQGPVTCEGHEHMTLRAWVEELQPEQRFSFRWQPQAVDPKVDYSDQPFTLVVFQLEERDGGTHLTVTESGFDALPEDARPDAFMRNEGGWSQQVQSIQRHVDG